MDDQGLIPGDLGLILLQLPLVWAEGWPLSAPGAARGPVLGVTHRAGCHPWGPGPDIPLPCLLARTFLLSSQHRFICLAGGMHIPSLTHTSQGRVASMGCQGDEGFLTALGVQAGSACVPLPIPIGRGVPITSMTNTSPLPPAVLPKRSRLWPQHPASCLTPAEAATAILLAWVKANGPQMRSGSPAPLHKPCPLLPALLGQPCPGSPGTASRASLLLPMGAILPALPPRFS